METVNGVKTKMNCSTKKSNDQDSDKVKINIIYTINIDSSNKDMTLYKFKKEINKNLFLKEEEYFLFIKDTDITNLPKKTLIQELINKYKDNKIIMKSYKNIFDIQKQLKNYDNFLSEKILQKNNEIQSLQNEQEKITKELKDFI